jgi:hypothetical protein
MRKRRLGLGFCGPGWDVGAKVPGRDKAVNDRCAAAIGRSSAGLGEAGIRLAGAPG